MTLSHKFAGALASLLVAGTTVIYTAAPSLAGMTEMQRVQKVGLIEEVKGEVKGVEFMDYVTPGQVIKLGPKGSIVVTYMTSCWRETITGGTVVIGVEQSLFHLSKVDGVKVDCHRNGEPLPDQQREAAAKVFRGVSRAFSGY
jgi:hypothetical protein